MKLFKCSILCIFVSCLLNLIAFADPTPVDKIIDDLTSTQEITPEIIIKLMQLQEILNGENLSQEIELVKTIKNDRYPNGQKLKDYLYFYYPNGQKVKDFNYFYYPNSQKVKDFNYFYYPNGQKVKDFIYFYSQDGSKTKTPFMIEWPPKVSGLPLNIEEKTPNKEIKQETKAEVKPLTEASILERSLTQIALGLLAELIVKDTLKAIEKSEIPPQFTKNGIREEILPKFIEKSMKEKGISKQLAETYFEDIWTNPDVQKSVNNMILMRSKK